VAVLKVPEEQVAVVLREYFNMAGMRVSEQ